MRFQFYLLSAGPQNFPGLAEVGPEFERPVNNTLGTLRADAIAEGDRRFAEIANNRQPGDGQIVLFTSTLGEPPGSIIAVEVIDPMIRQRRLQWAWSDGSIQIF